MKMQARTWIVIGAVVGVLASGPAALAAPGSIDPSFGHDGVGAAPPPTTGIAADVSAAAVGPDGRIVGAGLILSGSGGTGVLYRFSANGTVDSSFGYGGQALTSGTIVPLGVAVQADGKIVIVGETDLFTSLAIVVQRYTAAGILDPSFGSAGTTSLLQMPASTDPNGPSCPACSGASAVAIQPDGKIVVGGFNEPTGSRGPNLVVARLGVDGQPDEGFGNQGIAQGPEADLADVGSVSLALQGDGKILEAGPSFGPVITRFNTDGTVDGSWHPADLSTIGAPASPSLPGVSLGGLTDVRLATAGSRVIASGAAGSQLLTIGLTTSGALDPTFGAAGVTTVALCGQGEVSSIATAPGGSILVGGATLGSTLRSSGYLTRFTPSGAVDTSFGVNGSIGVPFGGGRESSVDVLLPPSTGRIVVVGNRLPSSAHIGVGFVALGAMARYDLTGSIPNAPAPVGPCAPTGYRFTAADGGIFSFGDATFQGAAATYKPSHPIVGLATTPSGLGYWQAASDGSVYGFGDAMVPGSLAGSALTHPVVGIAGSMGLLGLGGYWLATADGAVFNFGGAPAFGSEAGKAISHPVVAIAGSPDGGGYWLVASDGGLFNFGDAAFLGSTGALHLNQPIVGMAATPSGHGYWLVAADGGIFNFGDAAFLGSTGALHLNQPIVGMAATPSGHGYWLVAADGGIFSFGDAIFFGSTGGIHLVAPITGMAAA